MTTEPRVAPSARILTAATDLSARMVAVEVVVVDPLFPANKPRAVLVTVGEREPRAFANLGQAATFLESAVLLLP